MSPAPLTSPPGVNPQPDGVPLLLAETDGDAPGWASAHRHEVRSILAGYGAVQVRGLEVSGAPALGAVARQLSTSVMPSKEEFATREAHAGDVYSSSAWPPKQQMCMHHEMSYRLEFPGLMFFACIVAPTAGGSIGVADSPTVLDALPSELVDRFVAEGWMLTRSYTEDFGLSIGDAFGTDDHGAIESYCRANAIEFEWQDDGELRTRQRRNAVIHHPETAQACWFNQIAFLSEWTMKPEVHEFLVDMYGPDGLPFNTRYGNGEPIGPDVVTTINDVYEANTTYVQLQAGDLLLVDNIRRAHSREPYEGAREVVVALADAVRVDGVERPPG